MEGGREKKVGELKFSLLQESEKGARNIQGRWIVLPQTRGKEKGALDWFNPKPESKAKRLTLNEASLGLSGNVNEGSKLKEPKRVAPGREFAVRAGGMYVKNRS